MTVEASLARDVQCSCRGRLAVVSLGGTFLDNGVRSSRAGGASFLTGSTIATPPFFVPSLPCLLTKLNCASRPGIGRGQVFNLHRSGESKRRRIRPPPAPVWYARHTARGDTLGIPCKTAAGHAELVASQRSLSQRHRAVLLLVDGRRDVDEVVRLARQQGVSRGYLDELEALGLIVVCAPLPPVAEEMTGWPPSLSRPPHTLPLGDGSGPGMLDTIGLAPPMSPTQLADLTAHDTGLAQARSLIQHALLTQVPVSGAVTLLRVRRTRSRHDLMALLPEVQARLSRPQRLAEARQLIAQVERLLAG